MKTKTPEKMIQNDFSWVNQTLEVIFKSFLIIKHMKIITEKIENKNNKMKKLFQ